MQLHQVLVGAAPHDAITNMARRLRTVLERCGESRIYAQHVLPGVEDVEKLLRFPRAGSESGLIVFHASYGDPDVFRFLLGRPEPIVLVFHNLSPVEEFQLSDPSRAAMLMWGWRELELLRPRVRLSVADSAFNARDLEGAGYRDVHVIPVGVDVGRLARTLPDPNAMATFAPFAGDPLLVFVGQTLPHKRIDVLVHAQLLLDRRGIRSTLAVVGVPTDLVLARGLAELARDLDVPRCVMLGALGDDALAAVMRHADVFVTASEHEGLCLPVLEAMAMGVPVIARGAAALPETVGSGGLVLDRGAGPEAFAEAVAMLHHDPVLHGELAFRGRRQAESFGLDHNLARFLDVLAGVI